MVTVPGFEMRASITREGAFAEVGNLRTVLFGLCDVIANVLGVACDVCGDRKLAGGNGERLGHECPWFGSLDNEQYGDEGNTHTDNGRASKVFAPVEMGKEVVEQDHRTPQRRKE